MPIQDVVQRSKFQAELLRSAAIALGLLSDKEVGASLIALLENAKSLSSQAALAKALGFIGDAQSVEPLIATMENPKLTPRARGLAAAALGLVGDRDELPWSTKIAVGLNYRASTPTNDRPGRQRGHPRPLCRLEPRGAPEEPLGLSGALRAPPPPHRPLRSPRPGR